MSDPAPQWDLAEEVGGQAALRALVYDFYERVFDDAMIGFFFAGTDLDAIVDRQVEYVRARLPRGEVTYTGEPIRRAHQPFPILPGHFDRRHEILRQTLADHAVPDHVQQVWIDLEKKLRPLVVRTGAQRRGELLDSDDHG